MAVTARWRSADGGGLEHLVIEETSSGHKVDAVVVGDAVGAPFWAHWRLTVDAAWRTRRLDVEVVGHDRRLALRADGEGSWTNVDGVPLPDLAGAIDLDLSASPFTNTLPIRRLALPVGGAAEIVSSPMCRSRTSRSSPTRSAIPISASVAGCSNRATPTSSARSRSTRTAWW